MNTEDTLFLITESKSNLHLTIGIYPLKVIKNYIPKSKHQDLINASGVRRHYYDYSF